MAVWSEGWTGQAGFGGVLPSALVPDYQLYQWARLWWGHAFVIKVGDGKCKAVRRDGRGALVTSSWCDMKWVLADEWCERPVDAASWVDETLLAGVCLGDGPGRPSSPSAGRGHGGTTTPARTLFDMTADGWKDAGT